MATRGIAMTIHYMAWNTATNQGETGDALNHSMAWVIDKEFPSATTNIAEVLTIPGLYRTDITAIEADGDIGTLGGTSTTPDVQIMPITIQFERLPDAVPGATGGVALLGSVMATNLDAAQGVLKSDNVEWVDANDKVSAILAPGSITTTTFAPGAIDSTVVTWVDTNNRVDIGSWVGAAPSPLSAGLVDVNLEAWQQITPAILVDVNGVQLVQVDLQAIADSNLAAVNLGFSAFMMVQISFEGTPTTTSATVNLPTSLDTDGLNGRALILMGVTNPGIDRQAAQITGYNPSTRTLTYTELTSAPSVTSQGIIV